MRLSYDEAYDAAIHLIQLRGGTIDFCDKESGILSGHYVEFGYNVGFGLIALFIPVIEINEAPRVISYTVHLRRHGPDRSEYTVVRVSYVGSSQPLLSTQEITRKLESIAAERRIPPPKN